MGRIIGAFYLTPYHFLQWSHLQHHQHAGRIEGDTELLHYTRAVAPTRRFGSFLAGLARFPLAPVLFAPALQLSHALGLFAISASRRRRLLGDSVLDLALMVAVWTPLALALHANGVLQAAMIFGFLCPFAVSMSPVYLAASPLHTGMASGSVAERPVAERAFFVSRTVEVSWVGHFLNAFHIMVAEGERFMIRSMQPVLAEATDPLLRRSLVQFMAQEAQYAKEHRRVHRMLEAQGLRIARFDRVCRFVGRRVLPALFSRRMRIAITSGIEHWTASVGELVLEERWFATADPQMRDIFEWHSAEEIGHRAVAFDALLSFAPGYARRVLGFVFGTAVLLSLSMVGAVDFLLQTRTLFKRTTLRDLARGLSSGAMRRIQLRAMRYLAPRFHPHSGNTSGIAQATLLRLPTRAIAQGA